MGRSMALADRLDQIMWEENDRFLQEVSFASHLTDGDSLCPQYYLRHRIETIKRIRMTAHFDAVSLAAMVHEDYDAARIWARYICEELDHDRMFYQDLEVHGVSREQVDATEPLAATRALGDFLRDRLDRYGSIAAVAYSLFVEWNSARFSRPAVEKARAAFGTAHVEGSHSHLAIDETEDHYEMMCDVAERLCARSGGHEALVELVRDISALFRRYFEELHRVSIEPQPLVA
jgi:pyrroloquinoline quinone (PQQ) biosynthesis protein C